MFVESRDQARQFFLATWRKMSAGTGLEPLETVLAEVTRAHPEYHRLLDQGEGAVMRDFAAGDDNPFLHMGMHVALIEQLQADRPPGVTAIYRQLLRQAGADTHALDHRVIECLTAVLWQARSSGRAPDEQDYLTRLGRLLR